MVGAIGAVVVLGILFYVLYIYGYMVINAKRAVKFIGSIRGYDSCKASFTSCDGYMKRVMRFEANKTYRFKLQTELTRGTMSVEILDSHKQKLLELNSAKPSDSIDVYKGERYYLVVRFQSASGKYELMWN
ncbi:MAG: hypothetical protein E7290_04790 [Lachnospiraceae bacterium]|nr:hypothetical protein [Lachnospiraceae bacterium]